MTIKSKLYIYNFGITNWSDYKGDCDYNGSDYRESWLYIYRIITSNPKVPYYKNIKFSYITPEKIHNVKLFLPKRSIVIIFEDICIAPKSI